MSYPTSSFSNDLSFSSPVLPVFAFCASGNPSFVMDSSLPTDGKSGCWKKKRTSY